MCEIATDSPRPAAWSGVPRVPTRYAAISVLPWPGVSAWPAPNANAVTSERAMISGVRSTTLKIVGSSAATPPGTRGWVAGRQRVIGRRGGRRPG